MVKQFKERENFRNDGAILKEFYKEDLSNLFKDGSFSIKVGGANTRRVTNEESRVRKTAG